MALDLGYSVRGMKSAHFYVLLEGELIVKNSWTITRKF